MQLLDKIQKRCAISQPFLVIIVAVVACIGLYGYFSVVGFILVRATISLGKPLSVWGLDGTTWPVFTYAFVGVTGFLRLCSFLVPIALLKILFF